MLLQAAGVLVGLGAASRLAFWWLTRRIAHITTGAQRRSLCPKDDFVKASGGCRPDVKGLKHRREVRTLQSGKQAFGQLVAPEEGRPTHVLVFLHGYTSHSDMYLEDACVLARHGAAVLLPDLPCHGRSDGMLCYVPDWWAWVEEVWQIIELFLPLALEEGNGRPLKVFLGGISLGGGLAACLCVQRPTFFEGLMLVAPMLFVSDELKPPVIVQKIFLWFIVPLLPKWPLTPIKDMEEVDFRVPSQGGKFCKANLFSMKGLKTRLGSAREFGFTYPDWIEGQLKSMRTPLLILHGDNDKVTDPGLSKRLHEEASTSDKTLKMYEGAYHCELMSCLPGFTEVIGSEWLPEQTATTQRCLHDMAEWMAARA